MQSLLQSAKHCMNSLSQGRSSWDGILGWRRLWFIRHSAKFFYHNCLCIWRNHSSAHNKNAECGDGGDYWVLCAHVFGNVSVFCVLLWHGLGILQPQTQWLRWRNRVRHERFFTSPSATNIRRSWGCGNTSNTLHLTSSECLDHSSYIASCYIVDSYFEVYRKQQTICSSLISYLPEHLHA